MILIMIDTKFLIFSTEMLEILEFFSDFWSSSQIVCPNICCWKMSKNALKFFIFEKFEKLKKLHNFAIFRLIFMKNVVKFLVSWMKIDEFSMKMLWISTNLRKLRNEWFSLKKWGKRDFFHDFRWARGLEWSRSPTLHTTGG